MSSPIQQKPNDDGLHPSEVLFPPKIQRILTIIFLVGLLLSLLSRIFDESASSPFHDAGSAWSRKAQFKLMGEGNRRVLVGKDGWLYYRPGIDSITGYGPLKAEPHGVAKNPDTQEWIGAVPVISHFAKQLQERGIELLLVPVPDKASVHPEGIVQGETASLIHSDRERFFSELKKQGVEVVDLLPLFQKERKAGRSVFLKQDTHWKPEAMHLVADTVGEIIGRKNLKADKKKFPQKTIVRSHRGDLVEMLNLGDPSFFDAEEVSLDQVTIPESDSPVVVLGDSFVNIYDDPSLGFGLEGESKIAAGFAAHLSTAIGFGVQSFAINGDGATATRRGFAALPDNEVRSKKVVVWLIAERDIFMSRSTARSADVDWQHVEFSKKIGKLVKKAKTEAIVISARLVEKSRIRDPKKVNYPDAIYSAKFDSIKVISGDFSVKDTAVVFLWAFREKKMLPSADIKEGMVYHLTLLPLRANPEVRSITQLDDFFGYDEPMFATKVVEAP